MIDHPSRIAGGQSAYGFETRKLILGQNDIDCTEIVVELIDSFGTDDDARNMRLGEQPCECNPGDRDTMRVSDSTHLCDARPSPVLIDWREIKLAAA